VNNSISLHTPGTIHLVRPQDNHALIRTGPLKYICIKFYRDMISQEIIDMLENRDILLIADVRGQIESFIVDALELCQLYHDGQDALMQLELRLKLQVFLIRFIKALKESCFEHERLDRRTSCIHKTLAYIHDHYTEDITLNSAAEYAEISPNYLSSIFSSEMKMTFWNYITRCRLDKARMMLMNTDGPVSDISFRCGFHTYDGFIKAFKKQYSISPTAYRNKLKTEKHFDFERKSHDFT
jgi:AraC-like DNA-binding protein